MRPAGGELRFELRSEGSEIWWQASKPTQRNTLQRGGKHLTENSIIKDI